MNNGDRMAALSLAQDKQDRGNDEKENRGGLVFKKSDGRPGYGSEVANLLIANNGTVKWNIDDPLNGSGTFDTIYQYAAAEIHAPVGTIRERIDAGNERAHEVRSGFTTLSQWMDKMWDVPLFRVNEDTDGKRITIITIHPDYVIESRQITSAQHQLSKDRNQARGQVRSTVKRIRQTEGLQAAFDELNELAADVKSSQALNPDPRRGSLPSQPQITLEDSDESTS